jgi:hypothetical protein
MQIQSFSKPAAARRLTTPPPASPAPADGDLWAVCAGRPVTWKEHREHLEEANHRAELDQALRLKELRRCSAGAVVGGVSVGLLASLSHSLPWTVVGAVCGAAFGIQLGLTSIYE